jgi:hypothetical protein
MNPTISINMNSKELCLNLKKNILLNFSTNLTVPDLARTSKTKQEEFPQPRYIESMSFHHSTFWQRRNERISPRGHHGQGHSLPVLHLPPTVRNNLVAMLGEFVGTFLFLLMAFAGTQIAHTPVPTRNALPEAASYILVCLTFGLSLTTNIWAFYRVTGGLFNPVVRHRLSISLLLF